ELDRLLDAAVGAQLITLGQLAGVVRRGQDNHWSGAGSAIGADGSQHFQTVQLGQLQTEQDQPGRCRATTAAVSATAEKEVERFFAVPSDRDLRVTPQLTQRTDGELHLERAVLD